MNHSILFDHARTARIGFPEAVFCEGKPLVALLDLLENFSKPSASSILFTRLSADIFMKAPSTVQQQYQYDELSRTAFTKPLNKTTKGKIAVVSAGTADGNVTWEAAKTLEYLGIEHKVFEDCGVAGLWRLTERIEEINTYNAIIVVAGLEAALSSIIGGLSPRPIIAVPTSIGYGVCKGGKAALTSMLASCAPGITVMNIDNGYGAACAAFRILNSFNQDY